MNEQLDQLEEKMEDNIINIENSRAIAEAMQDTFEDIVKYANDEGTRALTFFEIDRVSARTETFFSMLRELLQESNETNNEVIRSLNEIKRANKTIHNSSPELSNTVS